MANAPIIAVVAFLESIAIAKVYGLQHGYEVDADAEMFALGSNHPNHPKHPKHPKHPNYAN